MPTDNVQNQPSAGSTFIGTLANQAGTMLKGAVIGGAAGAAVGVAAPVSKNKIAYQLADKFIKADPTIKEKLGLLAKVQKNEVLEELIKVTEDADIVKEAKAAIDNSVKDLKSSDIGAYIKEMGDKFCNKAADMVEKFAKQTRVDKKLKNESNDLVKLAKKCAKSTQIEKFIGIAAMAGVFSLLLSDLLGTFAPRSKGKKEPAGEIKSIINTHQG